MLLSPLVLRTVAWAQGEAVGDALTGSHRLEAEARPKPQPLYVLQPGDTLDVNFRHTPELSEEVVIGSRGRMLLKAAGEIAAAGKTIPELQREITHHCAGELVDPEVAVTLKDYDRPHIFVAGEVNTPGRIDLRRPTTALQAILASGGPKENAALGRVLLFRHIDAGTAEVHVLQLNHYRSRSHEKTDMLLQPDDMILVRHDVPSHMERYVKLVDLGFYLNPLQNVGVF